MNPIDELEQFYPELIAMMGKKFDTHKFILKLAREYQRLYILALAHYAESPHPFMTTHGMLAGRLSNFPDLVRKSGERNSTDIFGNSNTAVVLEKVT